MKLSWAILLAAAGAAAVLHVAAALAVRGVPLAGTREFSETVSELLHRPDLARVPERDPVRVSLGTAEPAPVEAPGPRAVLDPTASRRPPRLGPERPEAPERLAASAEVLALTPGEAALAARVLPPLPSAADRLCTDLAIGLGAREVTRPLPARFLPTPPLAELAKSARPGLRPREAKLRFGIDRALVLPPPDWPERLMPFGYKRPLRGPEIFVDVLDAEE